jgi:hypothetical protein
MLQDYMHSFTMLQDHMRSFTMLQDHMHNFTMLQDHMHSFIMLQDHTHSFSSFGPCSMTDMSNFLIIFVDQSFTYVRWGLIVALGLLCCQAYVVQ